MAETRARARACSTCSPAPARWGSRRCRAGPRSRSSWTSGLARGLIRAHVEAFGLGGQTRLFRRDATRLGPVAPNEPADLVFCDPPYGRGLAPRALRAAAEGGWLTPGALVVVEEAAEAEAVLPEGFTALDRRRSGDTQVVFARYTA